MNRRPPADRSRRGGSSVARGSDGRSLPRRLAVVRELADEPTPEDVRLGGLSRPARAIEHDQRFRQRLMLTRAVARKRVAAVVLRDDRDALLRRRDVAIAE